MFTFAVSIVILAVVGEDRVNCYQRLHWDYPENQDFGCNGAMDFGATLLFLIIAPGVGMIALCVVWPVIRCSGGCTCSNSYLNAKAGGETNSQAEAVPVRFGVSLVLEFLIIKLGEIIPTTVVIVCSSCKTPFSASTADVLVRCPTCDVVVETATA